MHFEGSSGELGLGPILRCLFCMFTLPRVTSRCFVSLELGSGRPRTSSINFLMLQLRRKFEQGRDGYGEKQHVLRIAVFQIVMEISDIEIN